MALLQGAHSSLSLRRGGSLSISTTRASPGKPARSATQRGHWLNLLCEQILECVVDELRVHGVETTTSEVSPCPWDDPQFRRGHVGDLPLVVLRRKIEVLLCRHHDRR